MKEEELIKTLESVSLPDIKLESHRRRLKMALLQNDYFKKKQEVNSMEAVKTRAAVSRDTILDGLSTRPAWKVALAGVLTVIILFAIFFSIPQTSAVLKSTLFPFLEGAKTISGPQLTAEQQQQALSILTADPAVKAILAQGAVVDKILPIQVQATMLNQETGNSEIVNETWAQAWLVKGDQDWGVQIDLVKGQVISITP